MSKKKREITWHIMRDNQQPSQRSHSMKDIVQMANQGRITRSTWLCSARNLKTGGWVRASTIYELFPDSRAEHSLTGRPVEDVIRRAQIGMILKASSGILGGAILFALMYSYGWNAKGTDKNQFVQNKPTEKPQPEPRPAKPLESKPVDQKPTPPAISNPEPKPTPTPVPKPKPTPKTPVAQPDPNPTPPPPPKPDLAIGKNGKYKAKKFRERLTDKPFRYTGNAMGYSPQSAYKKGVKVVTLKVEGRVNAANAGWGIQLFQVDTKDSMGEWLIFVERNNRLTVTNIKNFGKKVLSQPFNQPVKLSQGWHELALILAPREVTVLLDGVEKTTVSFKTDYRINKFGLTGLGNIECRNLIFGEYLPDAE